MFSLEELPVDQRLEDALSECWETAPLKEPVSVVGFPEVHLQMSCDRPCAVVAVRLCDVFPNGESSLITRGKVAFTYSLIRGVLPLCLRINRSPESVFFRLLLQLTARMEMD